MCHQRWLLGAAVLLMGGQMGGCDVLSVLDMVKRALPSLDGALDLRLVPSEVEGDCYELSAADGRVSVNATTLSALSAGVYHYAREFCWSQVTWGCDEPPPCRPARDAPLTRVCSPYKYRYAWNVCTFSYTASYWDWHRWEKELDWMALHGVNTALAFLGQEWVWSEVFKKWGVTQPELDEFFAGSAFLAWGRMGNIRGWDGPLTPDWLEKRRALQKQVVGRMVDLGITPVLPCFAGHVPLGLARAVPGINVTRSAAWAGFHDTYGMVGLLDPLDPHFLPLATDFMKAQIGEFGGYGLYNCDMFNEMDPPTRDPVYLSGASKVVADGVAAGDEGGVWMLQGWMFHNRVNFWDNVTMPPYLGGPDVGRLIVLDMISEEDEVAARTQEYWGLPWVWNLYHNFGGARGVYGNMPRVTTGPLSAAKRTGTNLVGLGMTPEAVEQNPVMFELLTGVLRPLSLPHHWNTGAAEMFWLDSPPDLVPWVDNYATRRYGGLGSLSPAGREAWKILLADVHTRTWSNGLMNGSAAVTAWGPLLQQTNDLRRPNRALLYDLVDVSRQAIQNLFIDLDALLISVFHRGRVEEVRKIAGMLVEMVNDTDRLLGSHSDFLLGRWLSAARAYASSDGEERLLQANARNQITLWGPNGEINDYAAKAWAGLYSQYYGRRYEVFSSALVAAAEAGKPLNDSRVREQCLELGKEWGKRMDVGPVVAANDTVEVSAALYGKYFGSLGNYTVKKNVTVGGGLFEARPVDDTRPHTHIS